MDEATKEVADYRIVEVLHALSLDQLLANSGGLDRERDFGPQVSSREQQLLAFARILLAAPRFVFLDRVGAMLGPEQAQRMLGMLTERSLTILHAGEPDERRDLYDAILECRENGAWTWSKQDHGEET